MYLLARQPWFKRLVVAVMLGAFLPAVVAAYACETTCAALSASASEVSAEDFHSDSMIVGAHELPPSDRAAHLRHGGVCQVASMVCVATTVSRPLLGVYAVMWTLPVEAAFVSFIWPPPIHPPRV
ncbi:MAG: hypothetical protein ACSLE9_12965 [Burkholderiaceae bacterium]